MIKWMYGTYLEVTLLSIVGKDRCKGEKRSNKRKRHAETHVMKIKVINVIANIWSQYLAIDLNKLNEVLFDLLR